MLSSKNKGKHNTRRRGFPAIADFRHLSRIEPIPNSGKDVVPRQKRMPGAPLHYDTTFLTYDYVRHRRPRFPFLSRFFVVSEERRYAHRGTWARSTTRVRRPSSTNVFVPSFLAFSVARAFVAFSVLGTPFESFRFELPSHRERRGTREIPSF